jgi:hypothetical protein
MPAPKKAIGLWESFLANAKVSAPAVPGVPPGASIRFGSVV